MCQGTSAYGLISTSRKTRGRVGGMYMKFTLTGDPEDIMTRIVDDTRLEDSRAARTPQLSRECSAECVPRGVRTGSSIWFGTYLSWFYTSMTGEGV
nr:hypothetical protein [Haloarcula sp. 1CSR25-25]